MFLGGAVSLSANVAHSLLTPNPPLGAVLFSVGWPVLLWVTTEIILRNTFTGAWSFLAWAGLTPVAVIAAVASYQHLSGLLAHYGETTFVTLGGPLAVDGLMVLSTGLLLMNKNRPEQAAQSPVDYEDDDEIEEPDQQKPQPYDTVTPLQTVSKIREQQINLIRAHVPDLNERDTLTWDQIGRITGISGRASIQRIRAALSAADHDTYDRKAL